MVHNPTEKPKDVNDKKSHVIMGEKRKISKKFRLAIVIFNKIGM